MRSDAVPPADRNNMADIVIRPHPAERGVFRLEGTLFVPRPRGEVFRFFADAANLERITPPFLRFQVFTPPPIEIREGALLDYKLRLRGLPLRWRSRITVWEPNDCFVDDQVRGPYRTWRHEHRFEDRPGGTLVLDRVDYSVWGGALVNALLVRRDLRAIFEFRQRRLREILG